MYNRYIPQPDGTFRRSRIPDPPEPENIVSQQADNFEKKSNPPPPPVRQPAYDRHPYGPPRRSMPAAIRNRQNTGPSISGFLKGLLPQNFDAEDLMVVLLLLLMSGNNSNDQNAAMLTLGIYLFL